MKAVIFDLDGVLADTVEFHYLSTKKVANQLNVSFTRETNQVFQGMNRRHVIEQLLKNTKQPDSNQDIEKLGQLKNRYYQEYIKSLTSNDVLPGMMTFLTDLKKEGIKMAIASSSSNAEIVLKNLEIIDFFDVIVPAGSITHMKPHPEIFLKAADKLNIPYNECVAIEDSKAGMLAIQATQMFSVGIGNDPVIKTADWHISTTKEISLAKLMEKFIDKNH